MRVSRVHSAPSFEFMCVDLNEIGQAQQQQPPPFFGWGAPPVAERSVGGVYCPIDLARSGEGDRGVDLSRARVNVVVGAAASFVHALAGDVKVDGGTGSRVAWAPLQIRVSGCQHTRVMANE